MKYDLIHHNDFHNIQFQHFNVKEKNIIMALCYKVMNQDSNLLVFPVEEIKKLSNFKVRKKGDNIYKIMHEVYEKIKSTSIIIKKDNGIKAFVLFTKFETFEDTGIIEIRINEEYKYMLNNISTNFTKQNILEYSQLKSTYSQLLYSLLKQWESNKVRIFTLESFRELLGVPENYLTSNLNERVLKPIMTELPLFFHNLKLEKIKTGKKVTSFKFSWQKKKEVVEVLEHELTISRELSDTIQKTRSNKHISTILTNENISILLSHFEEKDLVKGLNYAQKNIKAEFKKLTYLINSIKKGSEKKIIKIKVVDAPAEEKKEIIQTCIITNVSSKEYEQIYRLFLKNNELKNNKISRITFEKSTKSKYKIIE